ncbi:flagellar biosynthesis anti-sigma factor FlgM [Alteribacter populi]|uniref:flagellar biosynthesis anti-sigma factor FlgM n=1 Tax=Alteribacter populi TaxID=2011011 RepID=UPI000BBA477B|nr:flagellar biosynthesis anti-sigma factor FlgM [Alteribacter populi]
MKINPMQSLHAYRQQMNGNEREKPVNSAKKDEVQISAEAKKMQESTPFSQARTEKVERIKQQVEDGSYEIKHQEVARKFYEYWSE